MGLEKQQPAPSINIYVKTFDMVCQSTVLQTFIFIKPLRLIHFSSSLRVLAISIDIL